MVKYYGENCINYSKHHTSGEGNIKSLVMVFASYNSCILKKEIKL